MSQPTRAMRPRRRHRFPTCPATGLSRFGERKDARLAIEASWRIRGRAVAGGAATTWTDVRAFKCASCHGFHLARRRPA